jgi:hypothetical protein
LENFRPFLPFRLSGSRQNQAGQVTRSARSLCARSSHSGSDIVPAEAGTLRLIVKDAHQQSLACLLGQIVPPAVLFDWPQQVRHEKQGLNMPIKA